jgi:hypothetical protein
MLRRYLFEKVINSDPYLYESDSFQMYDLPLWAEMSAATKIGYISKSLATYNVSEDSVTRSRDTVKRIRFTISSYEVGLYLCQKYEMPEYKKLQQESLLCSASLMLACRTRDSTLADEIRGRRKNLLGWKDWYRYCAAKYSLVYFSYLLVSSLKGRVSGENKKWYE